MNNLTADEKSLLSEILRRILINCDFDKETELYTTNESLLISFDKKTFGYLSNLNKRLNQ